MSNRSLAALICLLALAAVVINLSSYLSIDNAWLLHATGRWLKGERLYVDLLETNPPLIVWLYALPAWLAEIFRVHVRIPFTFCVLALALASLKLAHGELRARHAPAHANFLCAALALALLLCSSRIFGQREHLWLILCTPYLAQSLGLAREPEWRARQWLAALMAAAGFALKPYFVVVWAANELFLAWNNRDPRWLLRRTNLVIAGAGLAYVATAYVFHSAYFHFVLPMLASGYRYYNAPMAEMMQKLAVFAAFYLLPVLFVRPLPLQGIVLFASACLVPLLQMKGWANHTFPLIFFGVAMGAQALLTLLAREEVRSRQPSLPVFALLCVLAGALVAMPIYEPYRLWDGRGKDPQLSEMKRVVEEHARGKKFYVFSFSVQGAFPLATEAEANYGSRFHHFWMMPELIAHPEKEAERAWLLQAVREDFERFRPALVIADRNRGLGLPLEGVDFPHYFAQDPAFAALWRQYRKIGAPPGGTPPYDFYLREN